MFEFFLATMILTHAGNYKPTIYAPFKDAASCMAMAKAFAEEHADELVEVASAIQTNETLRTGVNPGPLKTSVVCLTIAK